jgi:pimeloyl-ACP methyl ester carboxylesterase
MFRSDVVRIAKAWAALMQRLGYRRWEAQGGDWGAGVTTALGKLEPAGLAGIHLNFQFVFPEKSLPRVFRSRSNAR